MRVNTEDFLLDGILTKDDAPDGVFTTEEAEEALFKILEFFEANGWGFSGIVGSPNMFE